MRRSISGYRESLVQPNVLAFSCEAANAMVECLQDAARLRLLQRPVRRRKELMHPINQTGSTPHWSRSCV
jgi:hypothetical protein